MIVKLLTEHHLEFLSLKGGCRGSSESTLVKMPHCWKSHVVAHMPVVTVKFCEKFTRKLFAINHSGSTKYNTGSEKQTCFFVAIRHACYNQCLNDKRYLRINLIFPSVYYAFYKNFENLRCCANI